MLRIYAERLKTADIYPALLYFNLSRKLKKALYKRYSELDVVQKLVDDYKSGVLKLRQNNREELTQVLKKHCLIAEG